MSDVRSNSSEPEEVLPRGVPNLSGTIVDGRYQVGPILGTGGMGAVFEAKHLRLGRRVALKVLKPTLMHRDDYVERFKREATSASKIRHPNVVEIIDNGVMADSTVYTVMELLVGEDLSRRLKRIGRMPWPQSRWMLVQIVRALHAAHSQGIIHRDIKPANCFLIGDVEGQELVKVLDFGIAKLDQLEAGDRALTGTSEILGTPSYMAPEMARGVSADARSEVYSVGVLAYRMLGGQVPFDGNNAFDVLLQHATQAPPPLQSIAPELPAKVVELVHHLLQKDPATRPQDMMVVEKLLLSLDDNGQPCEPNPQSVYPVHPGSSGSAPIPRGLGGGINPTPSGSLLPPPPTPPPMKRDLAAPGLTMPPPGGGSGPSARGPARGPITGRPQAPTLRPPGSVQPPAKESMGTARTMFASPPTANRPIAPNLGAFAKPSPPQLGRPGAPANSDRTVADGMNRAPGPRRPAMRAPEEPDVEDRTMLSPSPSPSIRRASSSVPIAPPDAADRTMIQPPSRLQSPSSVATQAPPGSRPGNPRPAGFSPVSPAPASGFSPAAPARASVPPPPAFEAAGVDRTMMVDVPLARPGAARSRTPSAPEPVDRTMIHPPSAAMSAALHGPASSAPDPVDRTMIHPPMGGDDDLAERTMIHAQPGGSSDDDDRPKRTLMLDAPLGKPMTDRTMILDSGGADALELDASDIVQVADGGTQVVDINEMTKAAALAAVGIQAPAMGGPSADAGQHNPAYAGGPHGFAPQPSGPAGPAGPAGMMQSAPVDVYEPEPEPGGGGRWVALTLVAAFVALGAGGIVAWMLFGGSDADEVATKIDEAADGTPADDGTPAADGKPADDGTPANDDGSLVAASGGTEPDPAATSGLPEATTDDGATADDAAADDAAVADDGAAADDGADDDGAAADDGADDGAAADDGATPPDPTPDPTPTTKPKPKPKGPAADGTVKKRVSRAAAKKCSPTKTYTVSFLIGLGGDLKVPSVSPRDVTGNCILEVVRKATFRTRSTTSRDQLTVSG